MEPQKLPMKNDPAHSKPISQGAPVSVPENEDSQVAAKFSSGSAKKASKNLGE